MSVTDDGSAPWDADLQIAYVPTGEHDRTSASVLPAPHTVQGRQAFVCVLGGGVPFSVSGDPRATPTAVPVKVQNTIESSLSSLPYHLRGRQIWCILYSFYSSGTLAPSTGPDSGGTLPGWKSSWTSQRGHALNRYYSSRFRCRGHKTSWFPSKRPGFGKFTSFEGLYT